MSSIVPMTFANLSPQIATLRHLHKRWISRTPPPRAAHPGPPARSPLDPPGCGGRRGWRHKPRASPGAGLVLSPLSLPRQRPKRAPQAAAAPKRGRTGEARRARGAVGTLPDAAAFGSGGPEPRLGAAREDGRPRWVQTPPLSGLLPGTGWGRCVEPTPGAYCGIQTHTWEETRPGRGWEGQSRVPTVLHLMKSAHHAHAPGEGEAIEGERWGTSQKHNGPGQVDSSSPRAQRIPVPETILCLPGNACVVDENRVVGRKPRGARSVA